MPAIDVGVMAASSSTNMATAHDVMAEPSPIASAGENAAWENRLLRALLAAGGQRTWIWGTGESGRTLLRSLRRLGFEPAGFLDGQGGVVRRDLDDLPVHFAHEVTAARTQGALVLVASMYADDIVRRMRDDGYWQCTVLQCHGPSAVFREFESVESRIDRAALSEVVRRETKAAILELLTEAPEHPRQVNYARLAWLRAAADSAVYLTHKMQGAADFVSARELLQHAFALSMVDGLVLEFGVFVGTSLRLLSSLTDQLVHGFDSFEGLPEDWTYFQKRGRFSRNGQLPEFDRPNVRLYKGWFDATLPPFLEEFQEPVRFLHIDCDLYSSTATVLQALRPRIVSGTVITFDEYLNYPGWQQHEYRAFAEFLEQTGLRYRYLGFASSEYAVAVQIV